MWTDDLISVSNWMIAQCKSILSGFSGLNNIIGYAIVFIPIVRLVFKLVQKTLLVGHGQ